MKIQRSMMRGFLYGWLVGSTVGLVYAPRRGEQTRFQIRDKSQELKERMSRSLDEARQRSEQLVQTSADRTTELIQQAQALLDEQKATVISTVSGIQAGVKAYSENRSMEDNGSASPAQDPGLADTDILDTNINL